MALADKYGVNPGVGPPRSAVRPSADDRSLRGQHQVQTVRASSAPADFIGGRPDRAGAGELADVDTRHFPLRGYDLHRKQGLAWTSRRPKWAARQNPGDTIRRSGAGPSGSTTSPGHALHRQRRYPAGPAMAQPIIITNPIAKVTLFTVGKPTVVMNGVTVPLSGDRARHREWANHPSLRRRIATPLGAVVLWNAKGVQVADRQQEGRAVDRQADRTRRRLRRPHRSGQPERGASHRWRQDHASSPLHQRDLRRRDRVRHAKLWNVTVTSSRTTRSHP